MRVQVSAQIAFATLALAALSSIAALGQGQVHEVERAVLAAASPQQQQAQSTESYQGIYDAFSKLMQNVSNNSLGNVRRLVQRLNNLVAPPPASQIVVVTPGPQRQQTMDEKTEQILNRLDNVTKSTDQHTLSKLNEDVSQLIGTMNESYLRNIRRVIERVNKVVGQPQQQQQVSHQQSADGLDDPNQKPGFPGWDEFIVAMDRMQKSLAHFVRSSTRLITSGR